MASRAPWPPSSICPSGERVLKIRWGISSAPKSKPRCAICAFRCTIPASCSCARQTAPSGYSLNTTKNSAPEWMISSLSFWRFIASSRLSCRRRLPGRVAVDKREIVIVAMGANAQREASLLKESIWRYHHEIPVAVKTANYPNMSSVQASRWEGGTGTTKPNSGRSSLHGASASLPFITSRTLRPSRPARLKNS